jgi:hypothetical protein
MEELENLLLGHRRRIDGIIPRIAEIDSEIGTGDVIISDEILRDLTREELNEFFLTLTPKAQRLYREWLPPEHGAAPSPSLLEKFANVLMPQNVSQRREYCYDQLARYQSSAGPSLPGRVANWLIPSAHAAVAVGCLSICKKSRNTRCRSCVTEASVTAAAGVLALDACFDSCGDCRWTRPWSCACRGVCVLAFLAVVG